MKDHQSDQNGHLKIDAATHCVIQKHKKARRTVWSVMLVITEGEHDPKERQNHHLLLLRCRRLHVNWLMKIDETRTVLQLTRCVQVKDDGL